MNLVILLELFNLAFAGILAGREIAIHYGAHGTAQNLNEQSQLQLRQALARRLRILVPAFFLPAAYPGKVAHQQIRPAGTGCRVMVLRCPQSKPGVRSARQ
jgi:hypothetical protein